MAETGREEMTRLKRVIPSRRQALTMLGGTAAFAAMGPLAARAQSMTAVVGTWGGDYQNLLQENIVTPILEPRGVTIQYDVASAPPRKNKMFAERRLPRGSLDIVAFSDIDMFEMSLTGLLEELDEDQFPNSANIIPALRKSFAAPHIFSGLALVYNPEHANPQSWADMWDPAYAGRVGFADGLYVQHLTAATLAAGGNVSDLEPGKEMLMRLRDNGGANVYPSNEAVAQALQTGEIWMTPMWRARSFQWANDGIPVRDIVPTEGTTPISFEFGIPVNAPNKEAAYAFLDAMLEPEAQDRFADSMGYVPVVNNAPLSDDLEAVLTFTEEEQKRFFTPDYEYIAENNDQFRNWWTREFLA